METIEIKLRPKYTTNCRKHKNIRRSDKSHAGKRTPKNGKK